MLTSIKSLSLINNLNKKKMHFNEIGCDKLLKKSKAKFIDNINNLKNLNCSHYFITVGITTLKRKYRCIYHI